MQTCLSWAQVKNKSLKGWDASPQSSSVCPWEENIHDLTMNKIKTTPAGKGFNFLGYSFKSFAHLYLYYKTIVKCSPQNKVS